MNTARSEPHAVPFPVPWKTARHAGAWLRRGGGSNEVRELLEDTTEKLSAGFPGQRPWATVAAGKGCTFRLVCSMLMLVSQSLMTIDLLVIVHGTVFDAPNVLNLAISDNPWIWGPVSLSVTSLPCNHEVPFTSSASICSPELSIITDPVSIPIRATRVGEVVFVETGGLWVTR